MTDHRATETTADPLTMTATEMLRRYRSGTLSPVAVAEAQLLRMEKVEPSLNAFQYRAEAASVLEQARASAARWQDGSPAGPLDGVPVTIKDLVDVAGWPTRRGSATSDEVPAAEDSPCVASLRSAGAILLGKTTTPEFGWKAMTDSPLFGTTRSPWNLAHSPGGSSGGAAAAHAAGNGTLAQGNDGGGAVRIPASYCGLVGLKPTFGRVPHVPAPTPFSTLGISGPIVRSVADAALMLNVMAQPDPRDWYGLPCGEAGEGMHDWRGDVRGDVDGLRIAATSQFGEAEVDPEVRAAFDAAIDRLEAHGVTVTRLDSLLDPLTPQFHDYWRLGFATLIRDLPAAAREKLDPNFRRFAEEGEALDLASFYRGHEARVALGSYFGAFHQDHDILLTPTTPTTAPGLDLVYGSPGHDRYRRAVPFTLPFNLTGQPACSLPCGLTGAGLPVGLQVVAARHREDLVLRAARLLEELLAFPQPHPALAASVGRIAADG
ncbi:MAG: amidase [Sneathiellaceae bacterium]